MKFPSFFDCFVVNIKPLRNYCGLNSILWNLNLNLNVIESEYPECLEMNRRRRPHVFVFDVFKPRAGIFMDYFVWQIQGKFLKFVFTNLFVTSKNETMNSPIHEFKVLQNVF